MKRTYLGEFEEIVLLAVAVLDGQAYGVVLMHEIIEQTGRSVRLNQVHSALQRLEEKGMVRSEMGEPTNERGGRLTGERERRATAYRQGTLLARQRAHERHRYGRYRQRPAERELFGRAAAVARTPAFSRALDTKACDLESNTATDSTSGEPISARIMRLDWNAS